MVRAPISTDVMTAAILHSRGDGPDAFVETLHVSGSDGAYDARAEVRGSDYRIDLQVDNASYAFGRTGGRSWRQTPNGLVRIVRSDVQGDPLDRWPRSRFGFSPDGCASAGATESNGRTRWVLNCGPVGDIKHWYEIDPASGRVVTEITREGAKVVTYDFADDRHWTIHGFGGDATVTVTGFEPQSITDAQIAIPPVTREIFDLPSSGVANIPSYFKYHISTQVEINGVRRTFIIDTGTTQILIDVGEAARLGLHPKFGHVIIPELRVGDAVAHNIAAQAVDFFHDLDANGILGFEFFSGHIVHVNYRNQVVQLIAHDDFQPPKGARAIAIDPREGMPLVEGGANGTRSPRFALDTGSYWILLSAGFADSIGAQNDPSVKRAGNLDFLEGPMYAVLREMPSFDMGVYHIIDPIAAVEEAQPQNLDIPLDGIIGQNVLSQFEWWYDYDDGIAWIR